MSKIDSWTATRGVIAALLAAWLAFALALGPAHGAQMAFGTSGAHHPTDQTHASAHGSAPAEGVGAAGAACAFHCLLAATILPAAPMAGAPAGAVEPFAPFMAAPPRDRSVPPPGPPPRTFSLS